MKILNVSINLSKIDKSKIINGKKGKYANLTIYVDDEKDQYGNDVTAIQSQDKEEREVKKDKIYLGNGRVVFTKTGETPETKENSEKEEEDGFPF